MSNNPIGVFDSGIGGTSILRELIKALPNEHMVYLADSKNAPYGEKSKEAIIDLCRKNVDLLLKKGCKLIVVACNTATTNAIKELRDTYNVPFVGIEPAIKPAALNTKTHSVGVLATKGTLTSDLFAKTTDKYAEGISITEVVGKGLVPLIEAGDLKGKKIKTLLQTYMQPMIQANVDYVVLGCSHYPYLIPILKEILPQTVTIIDSGEAVAKQTKMMLQQHNIENKSAEKQIISIKTNIKLKTLQKLSDQYLQGVEVYFNDF